MQYRALSLIFASAFALNACAYDPAALTLSQSEAGSQLNTNANLGMTTVNNIDVQRGVSSGLAQNLTTIFAQQVPAIVNFDFNKSEIDGVARAALVQQANWIKRFPQVSFTVFGHADKVGSDGYNKALGLRRAQRVVNFLVSQGVERDRLEAVASFGETQPLVLTEAPNRQNRRAVTEVKGFIDGEGGELDGKFATVIYKNYIELLVTETAE